MKKTLKKYYSFFRLALFGSLLLLPSIALAAAGDVAISTPHPLGNLTIPLLIGKIIRSILGFTGVLTLIMFVYGGTLWMTAAGKPEQVKKAQQTMIYAVLGLIAIFASYGVVQFIYSTVKQ